MIYKDISKILAEKSPFFAILGTVYFCTFIYSIFLYRSESYLRVCATGTEFLSLSSSTMIVKIGSNKKKEKKESFSRGET